MVSIQIPRRTISVIGLGYVGLQVAWAFAAAGFRVIGFDHDTRRIADLARGIDRTGEMARRGALPPSMHLTDAPLLLAEADFHIVAVPTPVTAEKRPDLSLLRAASRSVGRALKRGDIVVFESTVYPGATEEECVPVLETESGLKFGADFAVGYSPERINPGDASHCFESITKVVSGSDPATLDIVASVYGAVVKAPIHRAPSIRVAEAAKVIENIQRDINIALMNELGMIFDRMGISTRDVLAAANTKWNFLPFTPGLVGGHCVGVDPYYLTAKAESLKYNPEVILAGRRVNDSIGSFIARKVLAILVRRESGLKARIGILGLTFKENVGDLRNSRVIDILSELKYFGFSCFLHDAYADPEQVTAAYGTAMTPLEDFHTLDALILAVPHLDYMALPRERIASMLVRDGAFIDVKGRLTREDFGPAMSYWSL